MTDVLQPIIYFGPPGTGKTTTLLNLVDDAIKRGVNPYRIAYLSFSRKAATEGAERACSKFGLQESDLPFFRTLHSLAYHQLGLRPSEVMDEEDLEKFSTALGLPFSKHRTEEDLFREDATLGDRFLAIDGYARSRLITIEAAMRELDFMDLTATVADVQRFSNALKEFKRQKRLLDFSDMLDEWKGTIPLELLIIDEAQDLTPQQWRVVKRLMTAARQTIIAGDDDQAIYEWAGANALPMLQMTAQRIILPKSYRLPQDIKRLCDRVISRVAMRQPKDWISREEAGQVNYENAVQDIDMKNGDWLIIARHHYLLYRLSNYLRQMGVVYRLGKKWSNESPAIQALINYERLRQGKTLQSSVAGRVGSFIVDYTPPRELPEMVKYEDMKFPFSGRPDWMTALNRISPLDREYYRSCLRNGESLQRPGRVILSTIHGAKGGEATNVVVLPTVNSRVHKALQTRPDPEHRLFYVAASRARSNLFVVSPTEQCYYDFPDI